MQLCKKFFANTAFSANHTCLRHKPNSSRTVGAWLIRNGIWTILRHDGEFTKRCEASAARLSAILSIGYRCDPGFAHSVQLFTVRKFADAQQIWRRSSRMRWLLCAGAKATLYTAHALSKKTRCSGLDLQPMDGINWGTSHQKAEIRFRGPSELRAACEQDPHRQIICIHRQAHYEIRSTNDVLEWC